MNGFIGRAGLSLGVLAATIFAVGCKSTCSTCSTASTSSKEHMTFRAQDCGCDGSEVAEMAMSGVMTAEGSSCNSCDSCQTCSADCGSCGTTCCGNCLEKIKCKIRNYDWEQLHTDNCWPEQYHRESTRRTEAPFRKQYVNGLVIEQTLYTFHFKPERAENEEIKGELSPAGLSRLQYLTRRRPYIIPQIYLQTSFDPELDKRRVETIVAQAKQYTFGAEVPWTVSLVNRMPRGLFGAEGPKAINNMIGIGDAPPTYEINVKQDFFGSGGGGASQ